MKPNEKKPSSHRHLVRINLMPSPIPDVLNQDPELWTVESPQGGAVPAACQLIVDRAGAIQNVDTFADAFWGYKTDGVRALALNDLLEGVDGGVLDLAHQALLSDHRVLIQTIGRRQNGVFFAAEVDVTKDAAGGDGSLLCLTVADARNSGDDQTGLIEARIARAERLETAGTVAGQIAHDFNNLLTPLMAYPELIRRELPVASPALEHLTVVERTASDMAHLTQQLLSLSRRGQLGTDVFFLNDLVQETISMLQTALPSNVAADLRLSKNLLPVKGSRDQMQRVLQNLCRNAMDAMPHGGTLRVQTENQYLDKPFGQYDSIHVGEYVKVSVTDTGTGIPAAIQDKIFDPFFTTKRASKQRGSGLGLSIVHGIVKDHGGYVDLTSVEGRGTTFYVYIPICRDKAAEPSPRETPLPHGSASVLVVDDDDPQVKVLVNLLQTLGYQAKGVTSGMAAVHLYRQDAKRFDLVMLDMIMENGLDGLATFKKLRQLVPDQRVILMSGFTKASELVRQAQQLGAGTYLHKPLTIERIASAVRDELDRPVLPTTSSRRTRRVLIVDDERMIRRLFGILIAAKFPQMRVDQAENGAQAMQMFQTQPYDLIVMDLQMPIQGGRETFVEIAKYCDAHHLPKPTVIFCTGFAPPDSLHEIIGDGSIHCLLRKPVDAETLIQTIRQRL